MTMLGVAGAGIEGQGEKGVACVWRRSEPALKKINWFFRAIGSRSQSLNDMK